MAEVAEAAGVSRALVSIVYRGVEGASEETRRRVLSVGDRLGYRGNSLASRLASKRVASIGVLLFDARNSLTIDVFQGIQQETDALGIGMVAGISDPSGHRDQATVRELLAAQVDALIMISSTLSGTELRSLATTIPLVSVTRAVRGVHSVVCDEAQAGALIVDHLLDQGYETITHLAPPWRPSRRVEAYEAAMERAGRHPQVLDIGYDYDTVHRVSEDLLRDRRPRAIYANNDTAAYAVLDAVQEAGLRVPEDVGVVGFDNLDVSRMSRMSLTSVDQQPAELGRIAARRALIMATDGAGEPRLEQLAPELIVRNSSLRRRPT